jgi:hypothetical protein
MTESKPLSELGQSAFSLLQAQTNAAVQQLATVVMNDAGLLPNDGWRLSQQPDGRWRFERNVPDISPEAP